MQHKTHYASLDGLRGVAAFSVAILHITTYFRQSFVPEHGYLAVDFFFLLSGFVISRAYDERLQGEMRWTDFLSVRLIRLYPMILLGIVLGTIVLLVRWWKFHDLTLPSVIWAAASAATLTPTPALVYFRPGAFPVDLPLWSLSLEMLVNIIYAFFFAALRKTALIIIVILGALAIVVVASIYDGLDFGFRWDDFWVGTVRVVFPFFAGVLIAKHFDGARSVPYWGNFAPLALLITFFLPIKSVWMFDTAATLFLFPMVVYIASRLPENPRTDGFCIYLGELSYPLYVLHYPIVVAASNAAHQFGIVGWRLSIGAFVCLVFTVAVAHISLNFYDKPIRKALTGRFRKREHARNYRTEGVST